MFMNELFGGMTRSRDAGKPFLAA